MLFGGGGFANRTAVVLYGGDRNDLITAAGTGNDELVGGTGGDTLNGSDGANLITDDGRSQADLASNRDADRIAAGAVDDIIWSSGDADIIDCGTDFDRAFIDWSYESATHVFKATATRIATVSTGGSVAGVEQFTGPQFVFSMSTATLSWDADGTGADAATMIAYFSGLTINLDASHIVVIA